LLEVIESIWSATPVAGNPIELAIAVQGMIPLRTWAIDLDRRLDEVQRDVDQAQARGLPAGVDAAESSLWRLSAARKSLLALCFLTLGVPTLEPAHLHEGGRVKREAIKKSLQWELHGERLEKKLVELTPHHAVAGQLNGLLSDLAEHPQLPFATK
jgi:hypothetical protein